MPAKSVGQAARLHDGVGHGTGPRAAGWLHPVTNDMVIAILRDEEGHRPVFGDSRLEQEDPRFRDNVLFYEYFHGATGRGLGASHQTGWTGLIALLLRSYRPSGVAQTAAQTAVTGDLLPVGAK